MMMLGNAALMSPKDRAKVNDPLRLIPRLVDGKGQTLIVPFDVISQHMMMLGNAALMSPKDRAKVNDPLRLIPRLVDGHGASRYRLSGLVIREIYRQDGVRGFYRGYLSSLLCYVPNSGGFWGFYHSYAQKINDLMPAHTPQLMIQCIAAPLGGISCTILTNPLDLIRARLQVQRDTLMGTLRILVKEEGKRVFVKGLSTRLTQSVISALFIVLGYESMKRLSVKEEYQDSVRW